MLAHVYGFSMSRYIEDWTCKYFSLPQISQIICSKYHTLSEHPFVLLLLAPLLKFWNWKIKKVVLIFKKIPKWTPSNQKFENLSTTRKFYFDLGPKRYWVEEILLLEVWVMGGGWTKSSGYGLLPINKCIQYRTHYKGIVKYSALITKEANKRTLEQPG